MGIEPHDVTLGPVRPFGVGVGRSPEIVDGLDGVESGEVRRVAIEVTVIRDEGLAENVREVAQERQALPCTGESETSVDRSVALVAGVLGEGGLVEDLGDPALVLGGDCHVLATLIPGRGSIYRVDSCKDRIVESDRLSDDIGDTCVRDLPAVTSVEEFGDLLLVPVEGRLRPEESVTGADDVEAELDVETPVEESAHVCRQAGETGGVGIRNIHEHVGGLPVVVL